MRTCYSNIAAELRSNMKCSWRVPQLQFRLRVSAPLPPSAALPLARVSR